MDTVSIYCSLDLFCLLLPNLCGEVTYTNSPAAHPKKKKKKSFLPKRLKGERGSFLLGAGARLEHPWALRNTYNILPFSSSFSWRIHRRDWQLAFLYTPASALDSVLLVLNNELFVVK